MPALLKSRSSRPKRSSTSAKRAETDEGSRTSHVIATEARARLGRCRLQSLAPATREDDGEAGLGQCDRRRSADAAAGARDHGDRCHVGARSVRRARLRRRRRRSRRSSPPLGTRARERAPRRTRRGQVCTIRIIRSSGSRRMSRTASSPPTRRNASICSATVAETPGIVRQRRSPSGVTVESRPLGGGSRPPRAATRTSVGCRRAPAGRLHGRSAARG